MPEVSDLTTHIGYLLRMASNAVSHEFARKVAGEGVTVAEWAMLRSLYDSDVIAPSTLAVKMGMTKGAISKLAGRLLDKGLIGRRDTPGDKRGHGLFLSPSGRAKVPVLAALADRNDADFFAVLDGAAQEQLRSALHRLIGKHGLTAMPLD